MHLKSWNTESQLLCKNTFDAVVVQRSFKWKRFTS